MNCQLEVEEFEVIVDGIEELLDPDRKGIYAGNVKNELNSIMGNKYPVTYEFGYIGKGAASEALIITIGYIAPVIAIFFSGKKIEENVDSWLRLINRVKHFYEKRKQGANIYVSLPAAQAYAFTLVASKHNTLNKLELLNHFFIPVNPESEDTANVFKFNPERIYSFIFLINDVHVHYLGIKSNLKVIYHERANLNILRF